MRIPKRAATEALAALTLLTLAACSRSERGSVALGDSSSSHSAPNTAVSAEWQPRRGHHDNLSDADIRGVVIDRLFRGPHVRAGTIIVGCKDGVLELTGTVNNLLAKERAVAIAEGVRGVRSVLDQIRVAPRVRADADLTRDVQDALRYAPAAAAYQVSVTATEGAVRLTGFVDSWQERRFAGRLARGVSGVKSVQNDLVVNVISKRPDADVKREIVSRLRWDALVNDAMIEVEVKDGNARLSGFVGSAAERTQAYVSAWVRGVRDVDVSKLEVEWWARDDALRGAKYAESTDAQVAAAVRDALGYDPRVSRHDVNITASDGRVTLSGKVETHKAKLAAESIAMHTVGVAAVDNRLEVAPREPLGDDELAARLTAALSSNSVLEGAELRVDVSDGNVALTGRVPTFFESAEAVDVASGLEGVETIVNRLTVTAPELAFVWTPAVFPYGPYVEGWRYVTARSSQSDGALSRGIQRELEWDPFVSAERIHIQVRDGNAILTGTVDDARARRAAEESALEAGAITVENRLTVG